MLHELRRVRYFFAGGDLAHAHAFGPSTYVHGGRPNSAKWAFRALMFPEAQSAFGRIQIAAADASNGA